MDKLKKELAENFSNKSIGIREVINFDKELYTYTDQSSYGIMIKCKEDIRINEQIGKISIYNRLMEINFKPYNCLIVSSIDLNIRDRYIDFIIENVNTCYEDLCNDPLRWWESWCIFLGNVFVEKRVYDIIGELYVLDKIFSIDKNTKWASTTKGSIDIENLNSVYEVKSTIKKYDSTITISSQQQLKQKDRRSLYLVFVRLENSLGGKCINDYVNKIVENGYEKEKIEEYLNKCGLPENNHNRSEKYKIIESRIFCVNDKFPRITNESFKRDILPIGICKISYDVDLNSLEYRNFENERN